MNFKEEIQPFENLEFLAKQAVEGFITGLHKSPFHGFSVEFAEHRQYNDGESTKHIDWKLFARTDKYFIKRYEEETNLRCRIVIDNSSSMHFPVQDQLSLTNPNKIFYSVFSAMALMKLFKKQRDAVGLSVFSDKIKLHTSEKTTTKHHQQLNNELYSLLKDSSNLKTTFAVEALHQIAENINQRSLVVLFSDMMDNSDQSESLFSALQHLRFNKHEVIIFHLNDKQKEIEFDYDNRPYKFVDMETGKELKLSPNSVKSVYKENKMKALQDLKLHCAQYKIDFIDVDINLDIQNVLLSYFHKRNKMIR